MHAAIKILGSWEKNFIKKVIWEKRALIFNEFTKQDSCSFDSASWNAFLGQFFAAVYRKQSLKRNFTYNLKPAYQKGHCGQWRFVNPKYCSPVQSFEHKKNFFFIWEYGEVVYMCIFFYSMLCQFYYSASTQLRLQSFGMRLKVEPWVGTPIHQSLPAIKLFKPDAMN